MKKLIFLFCLWQVVIIFFASQAHKYFPLRTQYLGGATQAYETNPLLYFRANFDGNLYLAIAASGYGYAQHAFFPMYPSLIRSLTGAIGNTALAGVYISLVSFFVGMIVFTKILALDLKRDQVSWIVVSLLFFPTSFFFGSVYTEGLFFLLITSSFYMARTRHWAIASLLGALATHTRFVGIFLLPALAVEWLFQYRGSGKKPTWTSALFLLLIPLGLIIYMKFLQDTTGDALAFVHAQKLFGQARTDKIVLLYQVFYRYGRMLLTVNRADPLYLSIILEFIVGVIFSVTTIVSLFKQRPSYAIFNILSFITPTLTGTFTSLPRYVLLCFPSFILIGTWLSNSKRWQKIVYLSLSIVGMGLYLILFTRGYWVS